MVNLYKWTARSRLQLGCNPPMLSMLQRGKGLARVTQESGLLVLERDGEPPEVSSSGEEDRIGCLQAGQTSQGATIDLELATKTDENKQREQAREPIMHGPRAKSLCWGEWHVKWRWPRGRNWWKLCMTRVVGGCHL